MVVTQQSDGVSRLRDKSGQNSRQGEQGQSVAAALLERSKSKQA